MLLLLIFLRQFPLSKLETMYSLSILISPCATRVGLDIADGWLDVEVRANKAVETFKERCDELKTDPIGLVARTNWSL